MNTIVEPKIARIVSKELLTIGAVSFNTNKPFRFVSGILSPMYTDNRLLISHPKSWHTVIASYIKVLRKTKLLKRTDVFSATATAAIPHAAALAYELKKSMVYVRSSKKDHGKENQIEGSFSRKSRVLIIEDLVSTGSSTQTNCLAVRESGGTVNTCVAITTSTVHAFESTMKALRIRLITLTDVRTTLWVALTAGYITKDQKLIVESFLVDPSGWGRKMGFEK